MKKILLVMMIGILLVGCNQTNSASIRDLEQEIEKLKVELVLLEGMKSRIETLEAQVVSLETQLAEGVSSTMTYTAPATSVDYLDPFEMTEMEYELFDKFVYGEYNSIVLEDVSPLSIFKMYIYADFLEDYKTQYQFFTKEKEIPMTLEEFMDDKESSGLMDFDIFFDVYNVNVKEDDEIAVISWQSKNGFTDSQSGAFTYTFSLRKEGKIWRVEFMPMQ